MHRLARPLQERATQLTLIALVLSSAACGRAPSGSGTHLFYPQQLPADDMCEEVAVRVEHIDQPTALGFSAIDVLARLAGPRSSPLDWIEPVPNAEYALAYGPERGHSTLTLEVRATDGVILHRYRTPLLGAPEDTECDPGALEIPVEVTLQSGAHALDETFATMLTARVPYRGQFAKTFDPGALEGGLGFSEFQSLDPERSVWLAQLNLEAVLWEGGSAGSLSGQVGAAWVKESKQPRPPPLPATDPGELALWPSADDCDGRSSHLPSDAKVMGFSARDVLTALESERDRELTWSDGSVTNLSLTYLGIEEHLCQAFDDVLEFDIAVRARTGDGRIDARLPVRVTASEEAGGIGEISLSRGEGAEPLDSAGLETQRAIGVELGSYRSVLVDIEMRQRGATDSGSLSLRGIEHATATRARVDEGTVIAQGHWPR